MSDSLAYGPEGCLSVPDRRGDVLRSQEIVIEYTDLEQIRSGILSRPLKHESEGHETTLPTRRDTIKGFTAVIFQHEIDHLDGILYVDHLSAVERLSFASKLKKLAKANGGVR